VRIAKIFWVGWAQIPSSEFDESVVHHLIAIIIAAVVYAEIGLAQGGLLPSAFAGVSQVRVCHLGRGRGRGFVLAG
jgi:hypothetical protein